MRNKQIVMRFNTIVRIDNSIEKTEAIKLVVNAANECKARNLKKGVRLMNGNVRTGYDGTDFVENRISAVLSFKAYKIPRFLSRHLLQNNNHALTLPNMPS